MCTSLVSNLEFLNQTSKKNEICTFLGDFRKDARFSRVAETANQHCVDGFSEELKNVQFKYPMKNKEKIVTCNVCSKILVSSNFLQFDLL